MINCSNKKKKQKQKKSTTIKNEISQKTTTITSCLESEFIKFVISHEIQIKQQQKETQQKSSTLLKQFGNKTQQRNTEEQMRINQIKN